MIEERKIRTENLYVDEIVHTHSSLIEYGFDAVQQKAYFLIDIRWRIAALGIDSNPTGKIKRVADQNRIAER